MEFAVLDVNDAPFFECQDVDSSTMLSRNTDSLINGKACETWNISESAWYGTQVFNGDPNYPLSVQDADGDDVEFTVFDATQYYYEPHQDKDAVPLTKEVITPSRDFYVAKDENGFHLALYDSSLPTTYDDDVPGTRLNYEGIAKYTLIITVRDVRSIERERKSTNASFHMLLNDVDETPVWNGRVMEAACDAQKGERIGKSLVANSMVDAMTSQSAYDQKGGHTLTFSVQPASMASTIPVQVTPSGLLLVQSNELTDCLRQPNATSILTFVVRAQNLQMIYMDANVTIIPKGGQNSPYFPVMLCFNLKGTYPDFASKFRRGSRVLEVKKLALSLRTKTQLQQTLTVLVLTEDTCSA